MTKTEMVDALSKATGLTRKETTTVADSLFEIVSEALAGGETVEVRGFGSFLTRQRNERIARNPKTGEPVRVPARVVPAFRPSKALKDRVAG